MSAQPTLSDQIKSAIEQNEVILFMKGTPDAPQCGFSARTSGVLSSLQVPFASVDVLPDPRIRQELTALFVVRWPLTAR
jgi:monothiol glutaredoxin